MVYEILYHNSHIAQLSLISVDAKLSVESEYNGRNYFGQVMTNDSITVIVSSEYL